MGLEVDNSNDELVEGHSQELATKDLTELHCVSQNKKAEECLSEKEEVTGKQQSSSAMREMLKAWGIVASHIDKHHLKKTVAMYATHLLNDNTVSHYRQMFEGLEKTNIFKSGSTKKELCMYYK
ncbi:hypothetical protein AVEN_2193-1 [Araneus ventricosus]|uniref:Uncharacterized protein n=1 Tax=Araneus ventricosus TaxID=182803 RepID=A0A4Y2G1U9_ARAVE|nr:hypothetical protein AVEN_2193-1 [Araneus ventricosus]